MEHRALLAWSGGKDSALAAYEVAGSHDYKIVALLTTLTKDYDRISMHGVRRALLEQQADSLGFTLEKVFISKNSSHEEYGARMQETLERYLALGVSSVVFGDIFLEDVRKYRENNLSRIGMSAVFPLWSRNTRELAYQSIDLGFKTIITCVDSYVLGKEFVGKVFDRHFLSELPASVDPCGENGEFHSFVFDGPNFQDKITFTKGEIVLRDDRFYYCDLIPA